VLYKLNTSVSIQAAQQSAASEVINEIKRRFGNDAVRMSELGVALIEIDLDLTLDAIARLDMLVVRLGDFARKGEAVESSVDGVPRQLRFIGPDPGTINQARRVYHLAQAAEHLRAAGFSRGEVGHTINGLRLRAAGRDSQEAT